MERKEERQAWIRWLTGPIVWSVYFLTVYLWDEAACHLAILSEASVLPVTLVLTFITLALIGTAGYRAWRIRDDTFANNSSVWLNGLFFFLTMPVGVTVLVLKPC